MTKRERDVEEKKGGRGKDMGRARHSGHERIGSMRGTRGEEQEVEDKERMEASECDVGRRGTGREGRGVA